MFMSWMSCYINPGMCFGEQENLPCDIGITCSGGVPGGLLPASFGFVDLLHIEGVGFMGTHSVDVPPAAQSRILSMNLRTWALIHNM